MYPKKIKDQDWVENTIPLVSVSCKTHNHKEFIRNTIEGFLKQQTTFPIEVLIHDDASVDGTADIIRQYEEEHPQLIKATYQVENQYKKNPKTDKYIIPHPRRGKYVALCEGDDYWTDPLKLQKQVEFLENNPDYSVTCGGYISFDVATNKEKSILKNLDTPSRSIGYSFKLNDMHKGFLMKTLTVVYRKSALSPGELANYKYRRDIHLFYHLLKNGKGYYFSNILGVYRIHRGGIFSTKSNEYKLNLRYNTYRELYEFNRDEITRSLYFNSSLTLLVYNFFRFFKNSTLCENFEIFVNCFKLFRIKKDLYRFFKNPLKVIRTFS